MKPVSIAVSLPPCRLHPLRPLAVEQPAIDHAGGAKALDKIIAENYAARVQAACSS